MIESVNPDIVVICTESGTHAEILLSLVHFKKHFVVEKPMALTLSDCDRMIELCDFHGCKLFVVKQNRFNKPILALKAALDAGRFGKLVLGSVRVRWCRTQDYYDQDPWRGTWRYDGGVLTNQAVHHLDMLMWLLGDVSEVTAYTTTALANIEVEDTAVVNLRFSSGALGSVEATTATRPKDQEGSISILGEYGLAEIGGFAMNQIKTWQFVNPLPIDDHIFQDSSTNPPDVYGFGHSMFYEHVLDNLDSISPSSNLIDGLQGRRSVELLNAIYESVATRKSVFLRFNPQHSPLGR